MFYSVNQYQHHKESLIVLLLTILEHFQTTCRDIAHQYMNNHKSLLEQYQNIYHLYFLISLIFKCSIQYELKLILDQAH